jgi:hypothetical protein
VPNTFDQFDTPTATVAQGTNPFDAFDGNVFDQFGEKSDFRKFKIP